MSSCVIKKYLFTCIVSTISDERFLQRAPWALFANACVEVTSKLRCTLDWKKLQHAKSKILKRNKTYESHYGSKNGLQKQNKVHEQLINRKFMK